MSLAIVYSRATIGINAPLITIEVHLSNGLPGLSIVGMPETAVKESKDRVRSAIINSQFEFPSRRITINLAPADLPKHGSRFDLAIAVGILAAAGQIPKDKLSDYEFISELALSGELRSVDAILPSAIQCNSSQRILITNLDNGREAALCNQTNVLCAKSLINICCYLANDSDNQFSLEKPDPIDIEIEETSLDFSDVQGQSFAKRALEICAAGNHNVLLYGSPGTGKTMLASRIPSIMPPLTNKQAVEVACLHSLRKQRRSSWHDAPFNKPHSSSSSVAIIGGGTNPMPGAISLSSNGVLFLDEFPEFSRSVIEKLREPLESREVVISRSKASVVFPAKFMLIAAMNPCPCGYLGSRERDCTCTPQQIQRYRHKISGPILDRIDLHIPVQTTTEKIQKTGEETSKAIRQRVIKASQKQIERQQKMNALLSEKEIILHCKLTHEDDAFLLAAIEKLKLSKRAHHRLLKVSRTIADLAGSKKIQRQHIVEALGLRNFDKDN